MEREERHITYIAYKGQNGFTTDQQDIYLLFPRWSVIVEESSSWSFLTFFFTFSTFTNFLSEKNPRSSSDSLVDFWGILSVYLFWASIQVKQIVIVSWFSYVVGKSLNESEKKHDNLKKLYQICIFHYALKDVQKKTRADFDNALRCSLCALCPMPCSTRFHLSQKCK